MVWTLRIVDEPESPSGEPAALRVTIEDDEGTRLSRRVRLLALPTPRDLAEVRWYLEDFLRHPYDPAPTLAQAAEERMRRLGVSMFVALGAAVADPIYDRCLGESLAETSVEVVTAPGSPAWELLRHP